MSEDHPDGRGVDVSAESPTRTLGGEAPTPQPGLEGRKTGLELGQVLGARYQIRAFLGRGGMGEVWRAFDLKLRVEVALKALRATLAADASRLDLLRQEVRAAREVTSPNVCRIYDLVELDGSELVSMEYVDGTTLLDVLREKAPLDPPEAQGLASQFLAGLEAIHKVGLVHRDVKPENIMLTRTGRVVLMDFGLARSSAEGAGSVSGTPAYMAPEQARGEADACSDLFSAGVILAEMVSPRGLRDFESRQSVWNGIRAEPVEVPESPWAPVVRKAVARDPAARFQSAHELMRALEDVAFRVHDETGLEPYPGLSSFDESDAEYFFGREAEVEAVWRKLQSAQLLGVIGASGSGKSSFLGAGLIPARPDGWAIVRCTPGTAAVDGLRRSIYAKLEGRPEAVQELAAGGDPAIVRAFGRWRQEHGHALLIVDQFEELFTQNGSDEQRRCAEALGRIALDADVHVLLSMRDDFLMRCHEHEALAPIFSELTPLRSPVGGALRRAVVQPALACGYRFEDEALADEILAEVEGERGALPLLAFALARLWEKRDRENGLITRAAFRDIGGVGGALAQHAEALMERLGPDRHPIVRELFRNLVTAEGTRAARDTDELLSVFADSRRESAAEVLRALIDSRLLTSYELPSDSGPGVQRVEVIHESLISHWPRLVGWRTQDADSARLRDELRQAARQWHEHGRTDDRLWTGAAFKEFDLWRERYPGGLTELEQSFAHAMAALATRRRRRRRVAAASALVLAVVVAAVFGTLWRRSVRETRRAEAAKLLALAQVQLEEDPTEALAYATSSLELADTNEARVFAVRALWAGPPMRALNVGQTGAQFQRNIFSPDGRWLVVSPIVSENVLVYEQGGGQPIVLGGHAVTALGAIRCLWSRDGLLVTGHGTEGRARVWSLPEGRLLREIGFGERAWWQVGEVHLLAEVGPGAFTAEPGSLRLRRWELPDGELEELGSIDWADVGASGSLFAPGGGAWIYSKGGDVYSLPLPVRAGVPATLLARHSSDGVEVWDWGRGEGLYSIDSTNEIILWTTAGGSSIPGRRLRAPETETARPIPDPAGRWAVELLEMSGQLHLWDLAGMRGAKPWVLRRGGGAWTISQVDFHPRGQWIIATTRERREVSFWPLTTPRPVVVEGWSTTIDVTPDGRYLVGSDATEGGANASMVRLWPLPGSGSSECVELRFPQTPFVQRGLVVDLQGRQVLSAGYGHDLFVLPVSGEEPRRFEGFSAGDVVDAVGFSPSGRLVAAATTISEEGPATLRVWDLETDEVKVFDQPEDPEAYENYYAWDLSFVDETTLYTAGANGLLRWNIATGTHERLARAPPGGFLGMGMTFDRRKMVTYELGSDFKRGPSALRDLVTGEVRSLEIPGQGWPGFSLSPDGAIWASGEVDGRIWVGRTDGGDPHLLLGHDSWVVGLAISPELQWVASVGEDGTLRLWPMPDLDKPPFHTLPHGELIAKLHSLTNLRAVRDPESSTGWTIELGPFPGWRDVPTW